VLELVLGVLLETEELQPLTITKKQLLRIAGLAELTAELAEWLRPWRDKRGRYAPAAAVRAVAWRMVRAIERMRKPPLPCGGRADDERGGESVTARLLRELGDPERWLDDRRAGVEAGAILDLETAYIVAATTALANARGEQESEPAESVGSGAVT